MNGLTFSDVQWRVPWGDVDRAATVSALTEAGFTPASVAAAVEAGDIALLHRDEGKLS